MEDTPKTSENNTQSTISRRKIVKTMSVTSMAGVGTFSSGASAKKSEVEKKYENSTNINEAINNEGEFITSLLEYIDEDINKINLEVDTVSDPNTSERGEVIRNRKGKDGIVTQLNIIRKTSEGPLNIVIYPDSDFDSFATRTIADKNVLETYTTIDEDGTQTIQKSTDDLSSDVSTSSQIQCPITCPTDNECCECVKECIGCCYESCTPTYTYGCNCCKYSNPSCWGDCY